MGAERHTTAHERAQLPAQLPEKKTLPPTDAGPEHAHGGGKEWE